MFISSEGRVAPHKLYLAGPMTGYPNHNLAEFARARKVLRAAGHEVLCPGEMSEEPLKRGIADRAFYMNQDIPMVMRADGIVLLKGWTASQGANTEALVAWQCGKPAFQFRWCATQPPEEDHFELTSLGLVPERMPYSTDTDDDCDPRSILAVADALVNGARRDSYGEPLDDYTKVATMVTGLFHELLKPGCAFKAEHIPMIVECMKLSREVNSAKRGNRVDGGGYWAVIDRIVTERARRMAAGIPVVECAMRVVSLPTVVVCACDPGECSYLSDIKPERCDHCSRRGEN